MFHSCGVGCTSNEQKDVLAVLAAVTIGPVYPIGLMGVMLYHGIKETKERARIKQERDERAKQEAGPDPSIRKNFYIG